jgi:hypothetical protein
MQTEDEVSGRLRSGGREATWLSSSSGQSDDGLSSAVEGIADDSWSGFDRTLAMAAMLTGTFGEDLRREDITGVGRYGGEVVDEMRQRMMAIEVRGTHVSQQATKQVQVSGASWSLPHIT